MRRVVLCCLLLALAAAAPARAGEWIAGDLHVHTTYSHDRWGGPGDDSPTDPTEYLHPAALHGLPQRSASRR